MVRLGVKQAFLRQLPKVKDLMDSNAGKDQLLLQLRKV